jgi:2-oxoglutarate dehydrogenase E2 component (dihydrolipoamide succinyltransferase)
MSVEIIVPNMGESVVEATVAQWLKAVGDAVKAGDDLVELETDKVNQVLQAEADGVLANIAFNEGDTVTVGAVLGIISGGAATGAAAAPAQPATVTETSASPSTEATSKAGVTPVAEAMANANAVDLSKVAATGPAGKVGKTDVASAISGGVENTTWSPKKPAAPAKPATPAPAAANTSGKPEERVRMSRRRQTIAANLKTAQNTAAMLTTFNEVDMSAVMNLRKRTKDSFVATHGVGLGFMSFFTKAVVGALKQFPAVNAELQADELVYKRYFDIGIAVGVEDGLVVPVIRDADKLSFAGIESTIKTLADKAKKNALGLGDMTGGSFTITNGGVYGSLMSTPILNYPQVGILGLHSIKERPVVVDGQIVIRPMMYIALSYDHRVIDGGTAVRFLVKVKDLIENPDGLLLEL